MKIPKNRKNYKSGQKIREKLGGKSGKIRKNEEKSGKMKKK